MATLTVQFAALGVAAVLLAALLTVADRGIDREAPPAAPVRRPVQVVAADLRRLTRQLSLVPAGASAVRWQALWTAYDDVLIEAAALLEVPHELPAAPAGMARDLERLRLLAALEGAGLMVRG